MEKVARETRQSDERGWQIRFGILLACQLLIFTAFGSVMPFLPLYFMDMGLDEAGAVLWFGLAQTSGSVVLLVATPLWGALSDRVGRKPMVLRALAGSSASLGLMALAFQPWQLLVLRTIQGATSGTSSTIITLGASVLPVSRLSVGMGMLQSVQFLGSSLGPLAGGIGAATIGYRGTFGAAGISLAAIGLLAAVSLREPPRQRESASSESASMLTRLARVARVPRLRGPLAVIFGFQTAYTMSMALISLHLASLPETGADATALIGLVLTANALGVAIGAAALGWLGGRVGETRVALLSLALTTLLTLPQAFLLHPLHFVPLRFVLGFFAGGVLPALRAVLGRAADREQAAAGNLGAVYGLAQSAFSGGMAVGTPLASAVATIWGLPEIHLASAVTMGLSTAWWLRVGRTASPASRRRRG